MSDIARDTLFILLYLFALGYLGWLGYRRTKTAADYMIAGRQIHPFIMALSYGATFISTAAIVGFGGVAGMHGMSLLWLVFLNIFVGIFISFIFLGEPTRRMSHHLGAHTFPELLGRRYKSKFIQIASGMLIFLFIPLYAAAVLIGGCKFIEVHFGISYDIAVLVFAVIVAAYVVVGGLKGVMYTDALQGSIMTLGMLLLLVVTYYMLGGIAPAHRSLEAIADLAPHQGWMRFPAFGFGEARFDTWWFIVSTITLGVGIGVLAQPQLVVRFMTVRSKKQLNRAVLLGGIFILLIPGTAYVIGSLSNAYFAQHGEILTGRLVDYVNEDNSVAVIEEIKTSSEGWAAVTDSNGLPRTLRVLLDKEQPIGETVLVGGIETQLVRGRGASIAYAGGVGEIIPTFIRAVMPGWFGLIFLLTLLAAAMSTLSSQFHTLGTSISRDVFAQLTSLNDDSMRSITVTRLAVLIGIIIAVIISFTASSGYIIAQSTAIFFGLCASSFLPAYVGGLFWKRITKAGAIASMSTGFIITSFWLLFIKEREAAGIGLVQWLSGKRSLLIDYPNWYMIDPIVIALPLSIIAVIVVSLLTSPPDEAHLAKCFAKRETPTK